MAGVEKLLEASIDQYREVVSCQLVLAEALAAVDPDQLQPELEAMDRHWQAAEATDRELGRLLAASEPQAAVGDLFQQRLQLVDQALARSRELAARASGTLAAVAAELEQIRSGRRAIAGYRPAGGAVGSFRRSC